MLIQNEQYLDLAISSANDVINSGKYTLTENYGGMFNDESPEDPEIIMGRYYLDKDATVGSFNEMINVMPNLPIDELQKGSADGTTTFDEKKTFDGWGSYWPTQDLVDQYLVIDEKTGEAKSWYESSQILDNVDFLSTSGLSEGSIETFTRFDGEKDIYLQP